VKKPALMLLLAMPAAAQAPLGTWTLASAPDIPGAIDAAVKDMNFVIRPIARGRLRKTNPSYQRVSLARNGGEFVFQYEQRAPQHMPADGAAVPWKREDGEVFRISARQDGEDLVQRFQAEDGERTNVFHVDPATRTLRLTVTVASGKLPRPLTYTLSYKPGA
jgi:hypothetical protein